MTSKHPSLHPRLENFSFFVSFHDLISDDEKAISFLEEIGLLPSKSSQPPECCDLPMNIEIQREKKLGWIWRCSSKASKKKGAKHCRRSENPCAGTFFDGAKCRIKICETLAIVISFVAKMKVSELYRQLLGWRQQKDDKNMSWSTVIDYYSYCREVAEVIASNDKICLGGYGKTVQIDETFLTKRKYHRGRITEQMTITVFGLYCPEDKVGLFFRVNSKTKAELWAYISKFIDKDTSRICSDSAKQYVGVQKLFGDGTVHLATNHSIGEYVNKEDSSNTINHLENQNKLLKRSILCRRTPKLIHQYMALYYYRLQHLEKQYKDDLGSQIMLFLLDIKRVYPGVVDGVRQSGLELRIIDPPTVESEGLEHLIPGKCPRIMTIDEELEECSADKASVEEIDTHDLF